MAEDVEKLIIDIQTQNEQKILDLQRKLLNLQKSVNTAVSTGDAASSKGHKTKISDIRNEISEIKLAEKEQLLQYQQQAKYDALQQKALARQKGQILQVGLSFLFLGMAVSKLFNGIAQSSFTTFNKLNADTELANNATGRLAGTMEEVRYVIGESLNAVLEALEPLIMSIVEWFISFTEQHPKLVATAIIMGVIGGILALWFGTLKAFSTILAGGVIAGALSTLKANFIIIGAKLAGWATAIWAAVTAAGKFALQSLGIIAPWLLLIGIIILIVGLLTGQEPIVKFVKNCVTGLAKVISAVMYFGEQIGKILGKVFTEIWDFVKDYFIYVMKGAINGVIEAFEWMINKIISALNWLIRGLNKVAGVVGLHIGEIGEVNFEKIKLENEKPVGIGDRWTEFKTYLQEETFQKDRWQQYMDAAESVGEKFEEGLKMLTDAIGTTKEGEGWNNTLQDLFGKKDAAEAEVAASLQESGDKQKDAADTQLTAAEKLEATTDKQEETVNKFSNSVDDYTSSIDLLIKNMNKSIGGAGDLSSFSSTLPSGSN